MIWYIPDGIRWKSIKNDLRPESQISDVLGCGGTSHLQLENTKFPMCYLADSQTVVFLTKIRKGILQNKQTPWANTETRLGPNVFLKEELNRQIAPGELGGVILKFPLVS